MGDGQDPAAAHALDRLAGWLLRDESDDRIPDDNPFPESPVYVVGRVPAVRFGPDDVRYMTTSNRDSRGPSDPRDDRLPCVMPRPAQADPQR